MIVFSKNLSMKYSQVLIIEIYYAFWIELRVSPKFEWICSNDTNLYRVFWREGSLMVCELIVIVKLETSCPSPTMDKQSYLETTRLIN